MDFIDIVIIILFFIEPSKKKIIFLKHLICINNKYEI